MTGEGLGAASRRRMAAILVAVSLASLVSGVLGGRLLRSPAEAAASRRPPPASPIRVPIERRAIAAVVTARGDLGFSDAVSVSVPDPGAVLTEPPPAVGAPIREGDVVVEVSERPVIALTGAVPAYRDLLPGSSGVDVLQLEQALERLHHRPGAVDGTFDSATSAAVRALYHDLGYAPPPPTDAALSRLASARAAAAQASGSDPDAARASARAGLAAAERRADAAVASADAEVTAAEVAERRAESTAADASARLQAAEHGRHPDTGEAPSPEQMAELRDAANAAADAVPVAAAQAEAARRARSATIAEQEAAVADARGAVAAANRAAEAPGADPAGARQELAEAQAAAAGGVPRRELVFAPVLPASVTSVAAALGSRADGEILQISGSRLLVDAGVGAADLERVEVGMSATVDSVDPEVSVSGQVVDVVPARSPAGRGSIGVAVTDPAGTALRGLNVRVRIPIDQTAAPVLAVPVSAVALRPDGSTRIEVERQGRVREVTVRTGLSADGWVEVAAPGADLRVGDLVTVGITSSGRRR
jgi:multidrug efflux pump subunit AcrA (membrane-fusion protein)